MVTTIKGYKVFNPDWTANDDKIQYEVGKEYHKNDDIDPREKGFYFCEKLVQCFDRFDFTPQIKAAEAEGFGQIKREGGEIYCSHIRILREISIDEISKLVNNGEDNIGTCNCGNHNQGDCNQGNGNEGNGNRGDCNRGIYNQGSNNRGDCNQGNGNEGNGNRGDDNQGDCNQGDCNQGDHNQGDCNRGDNNRGDYNQGNDNRGNCNRGDYNHGSCNIGIGNKGNYIVGLWCTQEQPFYLFNKLCTMPLEEFVQSKNYHLLMRLSQAKNPVKEWETFTTKEKQITLSTENISPKILKERFDIDVIKDK